MHTLGQTRRIIPGVLLATQEQFALLLLVRWCVVSVCSDMPMS